MGQPGLWQVLDEQDLRRKKSRHASERDTPRVVAQRQEFIETVAQTYDTRRFHLLDETGLRLDEGRRYGRARGGQRVGQAVARRRGSSLTLIGALSSHGLPAVQRFEGALNYQRFALYVSRSLVLYPTIFRSLWRRFPVASVFKRCRPFLRIRSPKGSSLKSGLGSFRSTSEK